MWKYTSYLKKGVSHEKAGTVCQDSVLIKEDEYCIVAALSDGLGSLKYSDVAANTATETICNLFKNCKDKRLIDADKNQLRSQLVDAVAGCIKQKAAEMGVQVSMMDCTLMFVYISKVHNYAIAGRLGDSAVCVIQSDDAVSLNDGNSSANGTCAVLDSDAADHLDLSCWDITKDRIEGFVLTSDGLDNVLYMKGSAHVNKVTEEYFNAITTSSEPQKTIAAKIAELTSEDDTPFDDDISIAVISRATHPIPFANDPTWLCICGARNRLQDTYCIQCKSDFTNIYKNIRFKEYGSKTAFFLEINKYPEQEREVVGIRSTKPIQPEVPFRRSGAASSNSKRIERPVKYRQDDTFIIPTGQGHRNQPQNEIAATGYHDYESNYRTNEVKETVPKDESSHNLKQAQNDYRKFLAIVAVCCLIIGGITGDFIARIGLSKKIDDLNASISGIIVEVHTPSEEVRNQYDGDMNNSVIPDNTINPYEPSDDDKMPENYFLFPDGSCYWGDHKDCIPDGNGILLKNGSYYIGTFDEGKMDGDFVIVDKNNPAKSQNATFKDDVKMPQIDTSYGIYTVTYKTLNVRSNAGTDNTKIAELSRGDVVYKTATESVNINGVEWIEVMCDNYKGWVSVEGLDKYS